MTSQWRARRQLGDSANREAWPPGILSGEGRLMVDRAGMETIASESWVWLGQRGGSAVYMRLRRRADEFPGDGER